ncbi:SDR family oxidoreductase [Sulfurimonas sp.]|uniref:SDR family oxidoreductase n=1 Tax=Sulfurimonas sp. TaxID=2022749 RepID=UPI0025F327C1|nr:SDR family oxidoreductase [Sulfurimonas sp.]
MEIKNKVAVVTGGASGLGLAIAQGLVKEGASVVVLDLDRNKLDLLPDEIEKYCIDITNYELVQQTVDSIVSKFSKIDILVNNAGVIYSESFINIMNPSCMKHSYDRFKKNLDINLNSVFIMSSIIAEKMVINRTQGVIINMSSISAQGNAGQTAYSAAKAAVEAMTKTWSKELGVFGIRSVAIAPGFINTESTNHALNEKTIKHIKSNTPLKRLGETLNIFQSVKYIVENDFVNGAVLQVDGGLTI